MHIRTMLKIVPPCQRVVMFIAALQETRPTRGVAHATSPSKPMLDCIYKHRQSKHPHMIRSFQHIHCQECNCNFRCKTLIQLRKHLEIHSLKMNTFVKTFKDVKGTFVYNF